MDRMIGIAKTGVYLPETKETAADLATKTGIPEQVIIGKFGLEEKRIASPDIHASDMAILAAQQALEGTDPLEIDVIIYFGSPYKDYQVWSCAPKIQHALGATNAYAFEMMNVSACFPMVLKMAKDMLLADPLINQILIAGGCKESQIVDYSNPRSRFTFNFADAGAAALIRRENTSNRILSSGFITDGSFYDDVKILGGGSVFPSSSTTIAERLHYIEVKDPAAMKERLDPISIPNFIRVTELAVTRSGYTLADIDMLYPLHTKRSLFAELLKELGLVEEQAIYLDHYGHMSALDPLLGLHFAIQEQKLTKNSLQVALSAGTGYTWAATALEWLD